MKNKKLLFILVPLNLFVWGYIGFVIYSSINKKEPVVNREPISFSTRVTTSENDTFTLALNYSDPFRDIFGRGKNLNNVGYSQGTKSKPSVVKMGKPPIPKINWPDIKYNGLVKNTKAKKTLTLVTINNNEYILKPGEVKDSVKLVAVFKDSIFVQYLKEKRTIKK